MNLEDWTIDISFGGDYVSGTLWWMVCRKKPRGFKKLRGFKRKMRQFGFMVNNS